MRLVISKTSWQLKKMVSKENKSGNSIKYFVNLKNKQINVDKSLKTKMDKFILVGRF